MDEFAVEITVYFAAQPRNQHINHIRLRIEIVIPDALPSRGNRQRVIEEVFHLMLFARTREELISKLDTPHV